MNTLPWTDAEVLVLGCGNTLYGDDGFGPAVAECLKSRYTIPDGALIMDAGSSVRDLLFDILLSTKVPRRIIVVDLLDRGDNPGDVSVMKAEEIPEHFTDDFSIHLIPSSNLLRELRDYKGVDVSVVGARAANIPEKVQPGLSAVMKGAVDRAVELIYNEYLSPRKDEEH